MIAPAQKKPYTKIMKTNTSQLPPYGYMNVVTLEDLSLPAPSDWRPPAHLKARGIEKAWIKWRDDRTDEIAEVLWPIFETSSGHWKGASAKFMDDLTRTDLDLMLAIQEGNPLGMELSAEGKSLDSPTHLQFFTEEDVNVPSFGVNYNFYDRTIQNDAFRAVEVLFFRGLDSKVGGSSVQWKQRFRRPRPYQTALLFGSKYKQFHHRPAKSSYTPSLSSGHCLQGLLAVGAIIEQFVLEVPPSTTGLNLDCLEQWSVDIGDRRVMAGVHYPSDNISSWILGMHLANRVYRSKDVKKRLWNAIRNRSFVYRKIREWVNAGKGNVYQLSLRALENAAASAS
jgi:hypothetical protein